MADANKKWKDAEAEILKALDIDAEYALLGVRTSGKKPTAKGWVVCHAIDRPDTSASCGYNVSDDPALRGRFKDFGGATPGETWSLFAFAAEKCGKFGGSWKEARNHYARQANVKLPGGSEELVADRFDFGRDSRPTNSVLVDFARYKAGIKPQAITLLGAKTALWPRGMPSEHQNHLLTFPMYGDKLLSLEPTGFHCVTQNPRIKIRKFKGKGNPDELIKSMTAGDYGLMNAHALSKWKDAKVIWIFEGISDLLAAQSALLGMDEETQAKHIVISAGGCSNHPRPEWAPLFTGKETRVVFDVGDKNDSGGVGAGVWAGFFLKAAAEVRNVKLPLGKDGGKNDARAWFAGIEGNTPHTFAVLMALADETKPIEQDEADEATVKPHEAILKSLEIVVAGEYEGSHAIEIYADSRKKCWKVGDIDRLTLARLIQLVGPELVEEHVHDGKEPMPGKVRMPDVRNAICAAASGKTFRPSSRCGRGVFRVDKGIYIVKARDAFKVEGTKLEKVESPFVGGKCLDISGHSGEWFDPATLQRYLSAAGDPAWCLGVLDEAVALFAKWHWRQRPVPQVLAGLICCAWTQTLWKWRPQVAITGNSSTGKSTLMQDLIQGLFTDEMTLAIPKPTEAAIRQLIKHDAKVIMVDEFENDNNRQKIYEAFRVSGKGGSIGRGTSDQKGVVYTLHHLPFCAAIEMGHKKAADRNRYIVLDLKKIPEGVEGQLDLPTDEGLADLGQRMLAVALVHQPHAQELANTLTRTHHAGVPGRVVELFAVPCSMLSSILGHDREAAIGFLGKVLGGWNFGNQRTTDVIDLLREVFAAVVDVANRERLTVGMLINGLASGYSGTQEIDYRNALRKVGIDMPRKNRGHEWHGRKVVFFQPETVMQSLIKPNGAFYGQQIGTYLERLEPNAKPAYQRLGGSVALYGLEIPYDVIQGLFQSCATKKEDDEDEVDNGQVGSDAEF